MMKMIMLMAVIIEIFFITRVSSDRKGYYKTIHTIPVAASQTVFYHVYWLHQEATWNDCPLPLSFKLV